MSTIYKGSCTCEAIKIEVKGDPMFVGLCHCYNCQKSGSSTYSTNWVVPEVAFSVLTGEAKTYEAKGGSGGIAYRKFCGDCSSVMWTESPKFAGIIVVKAGVLDGGAITKFTPTIEGYTSRRPDWVKEIEGAKQFAMAVEM